MQKLRKKQHMGRDVRIIKHQQITVSAVLLARPNQSCTIPLSVAIVLSPMEQQMMQKWMMSGLDVRAAANGFMKAAQKQ